jgi:hypothetical protein
VASSCNGVLDCHSREANPCPSPNSQTILNPEWQVNLLTEPVILIGHQHVAVFHLPCPRQIACFHLVLRVHHLGTHYAYDYIITRRAPRGSVRWFSRCGQPAICRSLSSTCMPPHISPWWALRDWVTSRRQPIPCQTGCNFVLIAHSFLPQGEQPQVDHEWTKKSTHGLNTYFPFLNLSVSGDLHVHRESYCPIVTHTQFRIRPYHLTNTQSQLVTMFNVSEQVLKLDSIPYLSV